MTRMHNPPHPGLTLRDDVLPALGLSVTKTAQQLDVARVTLSRMLNAVLPSRLKWHCVSKRGSVWNVEARPAYGYQNKAPMTCGKPNSDSRPRRCMFSLRRWMSDD